MTESRTRRPPLMPARLWPSRNRYWSHNIATQGGAMPNPTLWNSDRREAEPRGDGNDCDRLAGEPEEVREAV